MPKSFKRIGTITTPKSKLGGRYERIGCDLETDEGNPAGTLHIDIRWRRQEDDLVLGDRCSIEGNGMIMLRGVLGPENCGPLSFDGKANVLGLHHCGPDVTRQQLEVLSQAFRYAKDALATAFPGWRPSDMWLKRTEGCRDLHVEGALSAVRILQHAMLSGAVERRWDAYRRTGETEASGGPTLRFITHANGPEDKIYAKRPDTLRLEVACPKRKNFERLTGPQRAPFTIAGAKRLFLNFLEEASGRLDLLESH